MTPIILPVAELKPALMGLGKVVARRVTLPVISTIRIDRDNDGGITLSATDLDAFVSARLSGSEADQPGTVLVPFTALNNIAKACRGDDALHISPDSKNHVSIRYPIGNQSAAQRVESFPVEEWPPIPGVDGNLIPVPASMRSALLEAMQCASTDTTRYILQGAYIDVSDKKCHSVVGTDGRHLYASNSFHLALGDSVIVPDHKFLAWRGFAEDGDWSLQLAATKRSPWLRLNSGHWSFIAKPLEGNYPAWRQVLPGKDANKSSVIFPEDIAPVIEAVEKMPDPEKISHAIGLRLERGKLTLLGRNTGDEKFTEVDIDDATIKGEPVTILLDRNFLIKALRFGLRELQINDPLSAMRFVAEGRQMVVMPVRPDPGPANTKPVPAKSPEPATPQPEVQPTSEAAPAAAPEPSTERNTMPTTTTNGSKTNGAESAEKPALETAIAQVEILRGDFRNALAGLNKLSEALKSAQREQKAGEREVQTVRTALGKLQSVRI
jgi:DNA polymerase III sliding clamp (beta) subunit (PCNA family)